MSKNHGNCCRKMNSLYVYYQMVTVENERFQQVLCVLHLFPSNYTRVGEIEGMVKVRHVFGNHCFSWTLIKAARLVLGYTLI